MGIHYIFVEYLPANLDRHASYNDQSEIDVFFCGRPAKWVRRFAC